MFLDFCVCILRCAASHNWHFHQSLFTATASSHHIRLSYGAGISWCCGCADDNWSSEIEVLFGGCCFLCYKKMTRQFCELIISMSCMWKFFWFYGCRPCASRMARSPSTKEARRMWGQHIVHLLALFWRKSAMKTIQFSRTPRHGYYYLIYFFRRKVAVYNTLRPILNESTMVICSGHLVASLNQGLSLILSLGLGLNLGQG